MLFILVGILGGFGVWESHFTVISSMWLSVSKDVVSCFFFFQLFRQPFVFLRACSYPDRSTEFDPL